MSEREKTRAEKLVEELAVEKRKEAQFERWRWEAGHTFDKKVAFTRKTVTTTIFGFSSTRQGAKTEEELPIEVSREFHSFLAMKRNEAYRRIREIEEELESLK